MGSATSTEREGHQAELTLALNAQSCPTGTFYEHEATAKNQQAGNSVALVPSFLDEVTANCDAKVCDAVRCVRELLLTLDDEPAGVSIPSETSRIQEDDCITMSDEELAYMLECDLQRAESSTQHEIPASNMTKAARHTGSLLMAYTIPRCAEPSTASLMLVAPAAPMPSLRVPDLTLTLTRAQRVARYKAKRAQRAEPKRHVRCEERSDRARKRRRVGGRFVPSTTTWVSAG